jgi:TPR repeat protein
MPRGFRECSGSAAATGVAVSQAVEREAAAPPAPPAAARVPARPAATPTLSADDIGRAIGLGDALLRGGEIEAARFFFKLAADAGDRRAALRLGETLDPALLRYPLGSSDRRAARYWYQRALALGDVEAASRIVRLDAQLAR